MLSLGIRHGFGLWQLPIITAQGWSRESFSLALAVQNLSWGFIGIFMGMVADRFGAYRVLLFSSLCYGLGMLGMAYTTTPLTFLLTAGVLTGLAQSGTTYSIIYGIVGRNIEPSKRSWTMGVLAAAGSFGQFFMVPVEDFFISLFNWQNALVVLTVLSVIMMMLSVGLKEKNFTHHLTAHTEANQSIVAALKEAMTYPSFQLLAIGYFTCGFQVMFIAVHLPSYLKDFGLAPHVGSIALALIGLFNVFGTYTVGELGQRIPKKYLLMGIYGIRAVIIAVFINVPLSPVSVYIFAASLGFIWLSTVPPTNAIVAQMFGIRHFSMLSAFIFCSHQIGAFFGVWLGGVLYDSYESYDVVWYTTIALSIVSVIAYLPINEHPIIRQKTA